MVCMHVLTNVCLKGSFFGFYNDELKRLLIKLFLMFTQVCNNPKILNLFFYKQIHNSSIIKTNVKRKPKKNIKPRSQSNFFFKWG